MCLFYPKACNTHFKYNTSTYFPADVHGEIFEFMMASYTLHTYLQCLVPGLLCHTQNLNSSTLRHMLDLHWSDVAPSVLMWYYIAPFPTNLQLLADGTSIGHFDLPCLPVPQIPSQSSVTVARRHIERNIGVRIDHVDPLMKTLSHVYFCLGHMSQLTKKVFVISNSDVGIQNMVDKRSPHAWLLKQVW